MREHEVSLAEKVLLVADPQGMPRRPTGRKPLTERVPDLPLRLRGGGAGGVGRVDGSGHRRAPGRPCQSHPSCQCLRTSGSVRLGTCPCPLSAREARRRESAIQRARERLCQPAELGSAEHHAAQGVVGRLLVELDLREGDRSAPGRWRTTPLAEPLHQPVQKSSAWVSGALSSGSPFENPPPRHSTLPPFTSSTRNPRRGWASTKSPSPRRFLRRGSGVNARQSSRRGAGCAEPSQTALRVGGGGAGASEGWTVPGIDEDAARAGGEVKERGSSGGVSRSWGLFSS